MKLVKTTSGKYIFLVILSIIAAGGNMAIVYIINAVIKLFFQKNFLVPGVYLLYFISALFVFVTARWIVSIKIISYTQNMLKAKKSDILKMVLRSPYLPLIKNKQNVFTALTRDANNIVQASVSAVDITTNIVIVIICFTYMGFLSWKLLLCIIGLVLFTCMLYMVVEKRAHSFFNKAMSYDDKFVKYLNEMLNGFKEIVIDRRKGMDIQQRHLITAVESSVTLNKRALVAYLNNRVLGQIAFYLFIGVLLLYVGQLLRVENIIIVNFVFLVMYVFGPIETVIILLPALSQAKASWKRLNLLENDLLEAGVEQLEVSELVSFDFLNAEGITYQHEAEVKGDAFRIGPIDFSFKSGDIVFIYGGNGSGKTTFVNILVGLVLPDLGDIYVNGQLMGKMQLQNYRSLFAPVFSDFYLFEECYGIGTIDVCKAQEYLKIFELTEKVSLQNNKFTTINLSTGQRKRLALIYAMLEKKPVLILDEFAADQDPYFRKKFYLQILQFLKKEGFSVIAITHDDQYYQYCDHLYKMDYGNLMHVPVINGSLENEVPSYLLK